MNSPTTEMRPRDYGDYIQDHLNRLQKAHCLDREHDHALPYADQQGDANDLPGGQVFVFARAAGIWGCQQPVRRRRANRRSVGPVGRA